MLLAADLGVLNATARSLPQPHWPLVRCSRGTLCIALMLENFLWSASVLRVLRCLSQGIVMTDGVLLLRTS